MEHTGNVRPGRNGGVLRSGNPGNAGRPRSLIRDAAALAFEERIPFLCGVVDGEVIERRFQPDGAEKPIVVRASAHVADRLAALRELRAVGFPTVREVNEESMRDRLAETVKVIRAELSEDDAERVLTRLERVWR